MNNKVTGKKVAELASQVLRDKNSSDIQRSFAGSALSQRNTQNQTGAKMEDKASQALTSEKYNDITKILAASILSQSNKRR
jgi:hypothetical protein